MEDDIWQAFTKDIKPIKRDNIAVSDYQPKKKPEIKVNVENLLHDPCASFSVTKTNSRSFKRIKFAQKLDLHGYTLMHAEQKVEQFCRKLQIEGERYAIIITGKGKGSGSGQGILNEQIPKFFHKIAHLVISYSEARIEDGGHGAFYVNIRKYRSI